MEYDNYEIISEENHFYKNDKSSQNKEDNRKPVGKKEKKVKSDEKVQIEEPKKSEMEDKGDSREDNIPDQKDVADQKSNIVKKDKGIDYLFIFVCIRAIHFFVYYFKYFLESVFNNPKFDKNQVLWLFPIINANKKEISDMNNAEFRIFIIGYINRFEKEILTNKKMNESYRAFVEDVIYNFEWNNQIFDENHVTTQYSFESDLHYIIDIIEKLHLPVSKNKLRDFIRKYINLFDHYTESPDNKKINVNLSEAFYSSYTYLQGEIVNIVSKGFSWFGSVSGLSNLHSFVNF